MDPGITTVTANPIANLGLGLAERTLGKNILVFFLVQKAPIALRDVVLLFVLYLLVLYLLVVYLLFFLVVLLVILLFVGRWRLN